MHAFYEKVFYHARNEMYKSFPSVYSGPFSLTRDPQCSWEPTCQLKVNGWYKRCDSDRLMHLLTTLPLINPGRNKVHPGGQKDYPAPFYQAQCLHYGLPREKSKTGAKKALLAWAKANDGRLVVPPEVQQIEDSLRKQIEPLEEIWRGGMEELDRVEKEFNEAQLRKRKRQDGEIIRTVAKKCKLTPKVVSVHTCPTSSRRLTMRTVCRSSFHRRNLQSRRSGHHCQVGSAGCRHDPSLVPLREWLARLG